MRSLSPSPGSADDHEHGGEGQPRGSRKLFRREAWYEESWWYDEIVVATDEEEAESADGTYQGEGRCKDSEFDSVDDVTEISPDDLDEAEARSIAGYLADAAERDAITLMTLEQLQEWLKRKLSGDQRQGEGQ